MQLSVALFLAALAALAAMSANALQDGGAAPTANWPSWRGPDGSGVSVADPPLRWSETENVAWKVPLPGHGKSTPIVHGERIFLLAAVPTRAATDEELALRPVFPGLLTTASDEWHAFVVLALDRKTGATLWETRVTERVPVTGVHDTNGYASFSPVTDGDGVYLTLGSYGVYALDAQRGEVRWSYELGPQYTRRGWGEAGSPALHEGTLIVVADQEGDSKIHALDTATGKPRWVVERDEPSTWTTPLIVAGGGATQVVVNGTTAARSYELETGKVLWHCGGQTVNAIPSPVTDGRLVVLTSGYRGSACFAFPLDARGALGQTDGGIAWQHTGGTSYVPSPLYFDGRLYFMAGFTGRISCLDFASGEVLIDRQHLELGNVYASPIAAGGRIYVTSREGTTVVLRPMDQQGDQLEVLATNTLDAAIDATPVALGNALYLRSDAHLYAIGKP